MQLPALKPVSAFGVALAVLAAFPAPAEAQDAEPVVVSVETTEAGFDFHYAKIEKADDTAIVVTWPSDWIRRGKPVAVPYVGVDLMLGAGAGERDAATMAADFQDLQAAGDLDATADHVWGSLVVPPQHLMAAASLGRDVLVEPHLDDRWRQRLQRDMKGNQQEVHQRVASQSWDVVRRFILGNGAFNDFLTLRPVSLIDEASLAKIEDWHRATFDRDGMEITAAGPVEPDVVAEAIDRLLGDLPSGDGKPPGAAKTQSHFEGKTVLLHKPDAEKSLIAMIGPMPSTREPGYFLDNFATLALSGGQQSRLFDAVRTRLRASYGPAAGVEGYDRDTRYIRFNAEIEDRHLKEAFDAFRDAYEALRVDGITTEEFDRIRDALVSDLEEAEKRPAFMARLLMDFLLDDDPLIDRADELPDVIEDATLDEVNMSLRERLPAFDDMVRIVTTPNDEAIDADCIISSVAEVDRCRE